MQLRIKYGLDRIVALLLSVLLAPLLLVIGVSIRIVDGHPVFFLQTRSGLEGRPFQVWKFRTMVVDADRMLDESGNPAENRISKTGRLLRSSSLDELPNLFNIVAGQMSFVGPRPTLPEQTAVYTAEQRGRLRMKPGITGLAQISGRNALPWSRRIELDNQYIHEYSLISDARIIAKTVAVVLARRGMVMDRNPDQVLDLKADRAEEQSSA